MPGAHSWTRKEMTTSINFPFDKLPNLHEMPLPIFRAATEEVTRLLKTPPKMAIYSALAVCAGAAQMLADVEKPAGGIVGMNLYVLQEGKSGERKTTVDNFFARSIHAFETSREEVHTTAVALHSAHLNVWKAKNRVLLKKLAEAEDRDEDTTAIEDRLIAHSLAAPVEPAKIKLIFDDTTMAALKNGLNQFRSSMILSSDSKKLLINLLIANDADFNKLWSCEKIPVNRINRPSYTIDDARLTISLMIQIDVLTKIMRGRGEEALESGLFARFIFSHDESTQGERIIDITEDSTPAIDAFNKRTEELMVLTEPAALNKSFKRSTLKFSKEAAQAWILYFNDVETNIKAGGRYQNAGDHASKLADNAARVAGVLHTFEGHTGEIGMSATLSAIAICHEASKDYLDYIVPKDQKELDALELKDWLNENVRNPRGQGRVARFADLTQISNLMRLGPLKFRGKRIHGPLEILASKGYLKIDHGIPGRRGKSARIEFTTSAEANRTN